MYNWKINHEYNRLIIIHKRNYLNILYFIKFEINDFIFQFSWQKKLGNSKFYLFIYLWWRIYMTSWRVQFVNFTIMKFKVIMKAQARSLYFKSCLDFYFFFLNYHLLQPINFFVFMILSFLYDWITNGISLKVQI